MLAEAEERDLLEQTRAGKAEALDRLLTLLEQSVFGFALRMCRNVEDAREVLQDTFLSAIRSLRDFRGECRLRTWLYRITVNSRARLHRDRWVHPAEEHPIGELLPGVDGTARGEPLEWSEVARILGVSEAAVKTRLHRARLFVRHELDRYLASLR